MQAMQLKKDKSNQPAELGKTYLKLHGMLFTPTSYSLNERRLMAILLYYSRPALDKLIKHTVPTSTVLKYFGSESRNLNAIKRLLASIRKKPIEYKILDDDGNELEWYNGGFISESMIKNGAIEFEFPSRLKTFLLESELQAVIPIDILPLMDSKHVFTLIEHLYRVIQSKSKTEDEEVSWTISYAELRILLGLKPTQLETKALNKIVQKCVDWATDHPICNLALSHKVNKAANDHRKCESITFFIQKLDFDPSVSFTLSQNVSKVVGPRQMQLEEGLLASQLAAELVNDYGFNSLPSATELMHSWLDAGLNKSDLYRLLDKITNSYSKLDPSKANNFGGYVRKAIQNDLVNAQKSSPNLPKMIKTNVEALKPVIAKKNHSVSLSEIEEAIYAEKFKGEQSEEYQQALHNACQFHLGENGDIKTCDAKIRAVIEKHAKGILKSQWQIKELALEKAKEQGIAVDE